MKHIILFTLFVAIIVFNLNKSCKIKEGLTRKLSNGCPLPEKSCLEKGYSKRFCSLRPESIIGPDGCFCDNEGEVGLLGRILPENNCQCMCAPGIV